MTTLKEQIKTVVKTGDFILTSRKKTNFYIDIKSLLLKPDFLYKIGKAIVKQLSYIDVEISAIGGMEMSSIPISTAVCLASGDSKHNYFLEQFIIRKTKRIHGTKSQVEGWDTIKEKNVVIVDDVLTTGGSLLKSYNIIKNQANVVAIVVIIDRQDFNITKIDNIPIIPLFKKKDLI